MNTIRNILKKLLNLEINKVIGILIVGQTLVVIAEGFLAPIFAVFVVQKISPGDVQVVGFAIAIYWLIKSIIQIPLSRYLDRTKGENDDLLSMLLGVFLFVLVPILYIFVRDKYELYAVQVLMAFAGSLFVIPWLSIFTRHMDTFRIGFEWSLYSSSIGFGMVLAAALGGYLAQKVGFNVVFIIAAACHLAAGITLTLLYKFVVQKNHLAKVLPEMIKK